MFKFLIVDLSEAQKPLLLERVGEESNHVFYVSTLKCRESYKWRRDFSRA